MVLKRVSEIMADILNVDEEEINADMELTPEFEIEKIHIAKLVIECEKKFKIVIHDEKVHSFHTVGDVVKYIEDTLEQEDGNQSESSEEERAGWYYT